MQLNVSNESFTREKFRRLVLKTLEDYHPGTYDPRATVEDYMEIVAKECLEAKYGVHLGQNQENLINIRNMPWLDMGELPATYTKTKSEAFQVFVVPRDEYPNKMILEFNDWSDSLNVAKLAADIEKTDFLSHGV